MAFDLVGRISIRDDGASKTIKRVSDSIGRAEKITSSLARATDRLKTEQSRASTNSARLKTALRGIGNSANYAGSHMRSASRETASLVRGVGALAGAYMGAKAAAGLFSKTIGAAADYEMKEVTVNAMFGKSAKTNAEKYLDFVQGRAAVSMFSINDFLTAGKSFIPTTKDNAKLQKMVNLAERLGAIDPEQGIEGAAYALKEFFSGDAVSLVERFELPRKAMNAIKNLPLDKQLQALDKFLNGIGATNELINAQADTTLGQYKKAVAGVNRAFREMGTEALKKVNPLLRDFNKFLSSPNFSGIKKWGVNAFSGLVNGAVDAVRKASDYINTNFINNPAFKELPDIKSKIKFVFNTLMDDFNAWYDASGKTHLTNIAQKAVDTIGGALKASTPLVEAAVKLGGSIGQGIMQGILDQVDIMAVISPTRRAKAQLDKQFENSDKLKESLSKNAIENPGKPLIEGGTIGATESTPSGVWDSVKSGASKFRNFVQGHAGGLREVPYDRYPAYLHKGEQVLTREQAKRNREAENGGFSQPIMITGNTFVVRNDADIELIAKQLAYHLAR